MTVTVSSQTSFTNVPGMPRLINQVMEIQNSPVYVWTIKFGPPRCRTTRASDFGATILNFDKFEIMLSVQFVKKVPVNLNWRIYATKPDIESQTECFRRRSILVVTVTSAGAALVRSSSGSDYRFDSLKDANTENLQITKKVLVFDFQTDIGCLR